MKVGRATSFVGSTAALALMTLVSVAIGVAFKSVPDVMASRRAQGSEGWAGERGGARGPPTPPARGPAPAPPPPHPSACPPPSPPSVNVSHWLSIACLVYFGVRTLKAAWDLPPDADGGEGELAAAQEELETAEAAGRELGGGGVWRPLAEVGSIIFLAEWGDRSMLATIALAASQGWAGVTVGAITGHAVATAIAVLGGALAGRHLSERAIGYIGGALFLVFAAATHVGLL